MSRLTSEGARIQSSEMIGTKHFPKVQTLTGTYQVLDNDPDYLALDPGGAARNVDLPAATAANNGRMFVIVNTADAAEAITVRAFGGGSTIVTLAQFTSALVMNMGGTWRAVKGAVAP